MDIMASGKNIWKLAKARGFTEADLAEQLHVYRGTLEMWRGGKRQPSAYAVLRASRLFGVTMESLMKGVDDQTEDAPDRGAIPVGWIRKQISENPGLYASAWGRLINIWEGENGA